MKQSVQEGDTFLKLLLYSSQIRKKFSPLRFDLQSLFPAQRLYSTKTSLILFFDVFGEKLTSQ